MFGGAVISEDEVERISRELGIPFCIENDVDVVTFSSAPRSQGRSSSMDSSG